MRYYEKFINAFNRYCENAYYDDDIFYDMGELEEMVHDDVRSIIYKLSGNEFSLNDDYFRESVDDLTSWGEYDAVAEIVKYYPEFWEHYDDIDLVLEVLSDVDDNEYKRYLNELAEDNADGYYCEDETIEEMVEECMSLEGIENNDFRELLEKKLKKLEKENENV